MKNSSKVRQEYNKLYKKQKALMSNMLYNKTLSTYDSCSPINPSFGGKRFLSWVCIATLNIFFLENVSSFLNVSIWLLLVIQVVILILEMISTAELNHEYVYFNNLEYKTNIKGIWNVFSKYKIYKLLRNVEKLNHLEKTANSLENIQIGSKTNKVSLKNLDKSKYSSEEMKELIEKNEDFISFKKTVGELSYSIKKMKPYVEDLTLDVDGVNYPLYDIYSPLKKLENTLNEYLLEDNVAGILYLLSLDMEIDLINKYVSEISESIILKELSKDKIKHLKLLDEEAVVSQVLKLNGKLNDIFNEIKNLKLLEIHQHTTEADLVENDELLGIKEKILSKLK